MHSRTGVITSPNYPSAYGADAECEWEIRVDPGYKVIANFFQRFDLENTTNCQNDFVEVCFLHLKFFRFNEHRVNKCIQFYDDGKFIY